jgi:hypothetical protein
MSNARRPKGGKSPHNKFIVGVKDAFAALNKPIEWESFYNNDLPLVVSLDADVQQVAIEQKLNKSQAGLGIDQRIVSAIRSERKPTIGELFDSLPPLAEHGNQQGELNSRNRVDNVKSVGSGNSASYLIRRLKRDAPDIAEALGRGQSTKRRSRMILIK